MLRFPSIRDAIPAWTKGIYRHGGQSERTSRKRSRGRSEEIAPPTEFLLYLIVQFFSVTTPIGLPGLASQRPIRQARCRPQISARCGVRGIRFSSRRKPPRSRQPRSSRAKRGGLDSVACADQGLNFRNGGSESQDPMAGDRLPPKSRVLVAEHCRPIFRRNVSVAVSVAKALGQNFFL